MQNASKKIVMVLETYYTQAVDNEIHDTVKFLEHTLESATEPGTIASIAACLQHVKSSMENQTKITKADLLCLVYHSTGVISLGNTKPAAENT